MQVAQTSTSTSNLTPVIGTIALKTNERALYQNLKAVFSDSTKVFAELMQNARRAGASKVTFTYLDDSTDLIVEDDGCGIADFQNLLYTSTSGWDDETIAVENPFGMGFLATLYAAEKVKVESNGQECLFDTDHVLNLKPVDLIPSVVNDRTRITLINLKVDRKSVLEAITHYAYGFPILVEFNGNLLKRPHAIDQLANPIETEIGSMELGNTDISQTNFYVQGLPIVSPFARSGSCRNVIHLNTTFPVRMPDRNELLDSAKYKKVIQDTFKTTWVEHLKRLKQEIKPEEFVKYYAQIRNLGCLELLNDVPYLPAEIVVAFEDEPCLTAWDRDGKPLQKPLSMECFKQHINDGKHVFYNLDMEPKKHNGQSMIIQNLIFETNSLVVDQDLDKDHWLYKSGAIDLTKAEVSIDFEAKKTGNFFSYRGQLSVNVVDSIGCKINGIEHQFHEPALGHFAKNPANNAHSRAEIFVFDGNSARGALTQISDYTNEFDDFDENALDEDELNLCNYIAQLLGESSKKTIHNALVEKGVGSAPNCSNSVTVVGIDGRGAITTNDLTEVLKLFQQHAGIMVDDSTIQSFIGNLYFPLNDENTPERHPDSMGFQDFVTEFAPIENPGSTCWSSPDGVSRGFNLVGPDFDKVSQTKPNKVWSIINNDGQVYIKSGIHFTNRIGYCITKKARKKDQHISVYVIS